MGSPLRHRRDRLLRMRPGAGPPLAVHREPGGPDPRDHVSALPSREPAHERPPAHTTVSLPPSVVKAEIRYGGKASYAASIGPLRSRVHDNFVAWQPYQTGRARLSGDAAAIGDDNVELLAVSAAANGCRTSERVLSVGK